jgi:hypothetical protein
LGREYTEILANTPPCEAFHKHFFLGVERSAETSCRAEIVDYGCAETPLASQPAKDLSMTNLVACFDKLSGARLSEGI